MKLSTLIIVIAWLTIISCTTNNKNAKSRGEATIAVINQNEDAFKLLQQNCYACHSVNSTSHDAIIAPPMAAVVRRYKMLYSNKDTFIEAVTNWVQNPSEENALMRGAVNQFNVMPKLPINQEDLKVIANYIYENELEKPVWFEDHFNQNHSNGMGNGFRKGKLTY
jgi:hypothetical protein